MHEPDNSRTAPRRLCPLAGSIAAYHVETLDPYLLVNGCRRWACPVCGSILKAMLCRSILRAKPNRFLTVTCRHEQGIEHQLANIKKAWRKLIPALRTLHGPIEYCRILERCKDGYPHFHALLRSGYLPQNEIKTSWEKFAGATIVDIRRIHPKSVTYVAKYVNKANDDAGTLNRQRITVSKSFWNKRDRESQFMNFDHSRQHPQDFAEKKQHEITFMKHGLNVYSMHDRQPGDGLPEELQSTNNESADDDLPQQRDN